MGFLVFPVGNHQVARRRLFWNVGLVATAMAGNWVTVFSPDATGGHVVRALLLSWLLCSLTLRLSKVSRRAGADHNEANLYSAAATLALVGGMVAAFFEAGIAATGLDLLSSFVYVIGVRAEAKLDQALSESVSASMEGVHRTMAFAAALWVSTDLVILVATRTWQVVLLIASSSATVALATHAMSISFPDHGRVFGNVALSDVIVSNPGGENER
jgi:hypothetical protein